MEFAATHISGETTPAYMLGVNTPFRMARMNPLAKVLVILRDPVDRAYSEFQMKMRRIDAQVRLTDSAKVAYVSDALAEPLSDCLIFSSNPQIRKRLAMLLAYGRAAFQTLFAKASPLYTKTKHYSYETLVKVLLGQDINSKASPLISLQKFPAIDWNSLAHHKLILSAPDSPANALESLVSFYWKNTGKPSFTGDATSLGPKAAYTDIALAHVFASTRAFLYGQNEKNISAQLYGQMADMFLFDADTNQHWTHANISVFLETFGGSISRDLQTFLVPVLPMKRLQDDFVTCWKDTMNGYGLRPLTSSRDNMDDFGQCLVSVIRDTCSNTGAPTHCQVYSIKATHITACLQTPSINSGLSYEYVEDLHVAMKKEMRKAISCSSVLRVEGGALPISSDAMELPMTSEGRFLAQEVKVIREALMNEMRVPASSKQPSVSSIKASIDTFIGRGSFASNFVSKDAKFTGDGQSLSFLRDAHGQCWPDGSNSNIAYDFIYRGLYLNQIRRLHAAFGKVRGSCFISSCFRIMLCMVRILLSIYVSELPCLACRNEF
jgi:hypothetical protein